VADNLIINGLLSNDSNSPDIKIKGNTYISTNLQLDGQNIDVLLEGEATVKGGSDTALDDDKGILFNGSGSTIEVKNGKVYTKNIILEKTRNKFSTNLDVYVKDDLEMNNTFQQVDIGGSYYGFSYGGSLSTINTANSAIIINSTDLADGYSRLNIDGKLDLYGVSYIKGTNYATGESLSILGNNGSYTQPLSSGTSEGRSLAWNNIDFVSFDPLPPLAYKFLSTNEVMTPWHKADYFIQYRNENISSLNLGNGNITVGGTIRTLGTAIDGSTLNSTAYNLAFIDEINNNNIPKNTYDSKIANFYDEVFKNKVISNEDIKIISDEILYIDNDSITINNGKHGGNEIKRGLIVTNGDVIINGSFDFSGAIICGGDIITNISPSENINIKYDEKSIAKLIEEYELYDDLFAGNIVGTVNITSYVNGSAGDVDFNQYLQFKNWKIEN